MFILILLAKLYTIDYKINIKSILSVIGALLELVLFIIILLYIRTIILT